MKSYAVKPVTETILQIMSNKSLVFGKDEPIHIREFSFPQSNLKLTLDEFYLFDPTLKVRKTSSHESDSKYSIGSACKSLRATGVSKDKAACFALVLSSDERLDAMIEMPRLIRDKSLYDRYWPRSHLSNFFAGKNKIFYAFQEKFKSSPQIAVGGSTAWLYIISGTIKVVLIKPTSVNLIKYSTLSERESFEPESGSSVTYTLKDGHFIAIPPGWISVKKATQTTFALGGEILHEDCLSLQLKLFDDGPCELVNHERDAEIRSLYWFYAIKLLEKPAQSMDQLALVKPYLENWKARTSKSENTKDPYIKPSFFSPHGIKIDSIVRDIKIKLRKSVSKC